MKEHAEQLCMIYGYLKKFERNIDYFIRNSHLFTSKLGIERVRDFKKIFITSTMLGGADNYNGIYIVDEASFSAFCVDILLLLGTFVVVKNIHKRCSLL